VSTAAPPALPPRAIDPSSLPTAPATGSNPSPIDRDAPRPSSPAPVEESRAADRIRKIAARVPVVEPVGGNAALSLIRSSFSTGSRLWKIAEGQPEPDLLGASR
jgi:hypothetical protein